jgi:hypothetical protein
MNHEFDHDHVVFIAGEKANMCGVQYEGWYFMMADGNFRGPYSSKHEAILAERRYLEDHR